MMLIDLHIHLVIAVKCCLFRVSKESAVGKAICSLSSHLPYFPLSMKGLLPSLSREEDAPRRALHHFRLADETARRSYLSPREPTRGARASERQHEHAIRGEKRNHLGLSDGFCDRLIRLAIQNRRRWGSVREERSAARLKETEIWDSQTIL